MLDSCGGAWNPNASSDWPSGGRLPAAAAADQKPWRSLATPPGVIVYSCGCFPARGMRKAHPLATTQVSPRCTCVTLHVKRVAIVAAVQAPSNGPGCPSISNTTQYKADCTPFVDCPSIEPSAPSHAFGSGSPPTRHIEQPRQAHRTAERPALSLAKENVGDVGENHRTHVWRTQA